MNTIAIAMCELRDFDSIQLVMPDLHSVPRGKVVAGPLKETMCKEGMDCWRGALMMGPKCELPYSVKELCESYPSHEMRPCLETLRPWPWAGREGHRAGLMLCDMYLPDGSPDLCCPRQLLRAQLDALWREHGLVLKTGLEYEFFAFKDPESRQPLGIANRLQFMDMRVWSDHEEAMTEVREALEAVGVSVKTLAPEFAPGQWELTTPPYAGLEGADVGFYVKNAVKGVMQRRGRSATFMTRPALDSIGSGLHLNHSLWRPLPAHAPRDVSESGEATNVFLATESEASGPLSDLAKHWMAGLLEHAPALTALQCPTLNCYRRLHNLCSPSLATWALEDRQAMVRARATPGDNVFLENRLPSSAASPYLAIAATVAAGRDGLKRRLRCPKANDVAGAPKLPSSLAEALNALQGDCEMTSLLGEEFVRCYIQAKREVEVVPSTLRGQGVDSEADLMAFERDLYLLTY